MVQMWRHYFGSQAHILGVDINPECRRFAGAQVDIEIGDQADREFWQDPARKMPRIDILMEEPARFGVPDFTHSTHGVRFYDRVLALERNSHDVRPATKVGSPARSAPSLKAPAALGATGAGIRGGKRAMPDWSRSGPRRTGSTEERGFEGRAPKHCCVRFRWSLRCHGTEGHTYNQPRRVSGMKSECQ